MTKSFDVHVLLSHLEPVLGKPVNGLKGVWGSEQNILELSRLIFLGKTVAEEWAQILGAKATNMIGCRDHFHICKHFQLKGLLEDKYYICVFGGQLM